MNAGLSFRTHEEKEKPKRVKRGKKTGREGEEEEGGGMNIGKDKSQ